tara:strand:- start:4 stop:2763 length:2760 start_codon:yes stop_codon:yes gene_type:complete
MINFKKISAVILIELSLLSVVVVNPLELRSEIINENISRETYPKDLDILEKLVDKARQDGNLEKELEIAHQILEIISEFDNSDKKIESYKKVLENFSEYQRADLLNLLTSIGIVYGLLGEYDLAINLINEVIKTAEKFYDELKLEIAYYYSELGHIYYQVGDYAKAETSYEKSVDINVVELGFHEDTATGINNLGSMYLDQGQYEKATEYLERALLMRKELNPLDKTYWISTLSNLGRAYAELNYYYFGDYGKSSNYLKKSKKYILKAYKLAKNLLSENNPLFLTTINNLGGYYLDIGNNRKAIKIYEEALFTKEKYLGRSHPDVAITLNNLAMAYLNKKNFKYALEYSKRALDIYYENYGGIDHPDISLTLNNIAGIYKESGNDDKSNIFARKGIETELRFIQKEAPYLPEEDRFDFVDSFGDGPDMAFTQALKSSSGLDLAFFVRLNRQGLLEDIEKKQNELINLSKKDQKLIKQFNDILNKLSDASISEDDRNELILEKSFLEKKIYRLLPKLNFEIVDSKIISKKLPLKSILIEYQKYSPYQPLSETGEIWGAPRYIALILYNDGQSKSFDLGLSLPIDKKIQKALAASEKGLEDAQDLWNNVGKLIIYPLKNLLGDSDTLFISPDAGLNRVPFSAISSHREDQLLGDAVKIRILTTGRELLNLAKSSKSNKQKTLVVANPAFNLNKTFRSKKTIELITSKQSQKRSGDLDLFKWDPLPGTAKEGKIIAELTNAQLLTKNQATALALQERKAPKILHIASHAYYLPDQGKGENPLLRSGIVLAGANDPETNPKDDGYLTALEVAKVDWQGTELVVISACESGKGDIQSGEGVYGLKRAIAVAGARSSVLSLWKVDDIATADFMEKFYQKLKDGMGRSEALAETQKEFKNHSILRFRHPYYWAGFQLSGDWRPIDF